MERRKSRRVRCRLACEIHGARKRATGTVLDMSEGGLAVQTALKADQGDTLRIRIQARGGPLEVETLVWHSRQVRLRGASETSWALGLMISDAPDQYFQLVPQGDTHAKSKEPEVSADEVTEEAAPELPAFRIRVKQLAAPRTRVLSLNAESEDEARALATADLKGEWEILEVWAA
jgi:hypothetical protein